MDTITKFLVNNIFEQTKINNSYYIIKQSPISGKGCFANQNIDKNTNIGLAFKKVKNTGKDDIDYIRTELGKFTNHSNRPNTRLVNDNKDFYFFSIEDIRKGEELTIDYQTFPWEGKRNFDDQSNYSGYLYHYSNKKYNTLQTFRRQKEFGKTSERMEKKFNRDDPLGRGLSYYDQISFFLEPIPIDDIRKKIPENSFYNNVELYEHVIRIEELDEDIVFQVVSAPFEALFMTFITRITTNVNLMIKLMKIFSKMTIVLYKLNGRKKLIRIQEKYMGKTQKDFEVWFTSKEPGKIAARKNSYQAGIIHVKVYPKSGEIKVNSVKKI